MEFWAWESHISEVYSVPSTGLFCNFVSWSILRGEWKLSEDKLPVRIQRRLISSSPSCCYRTLQYVWREWKMKRNRCFLWVYREELGPFTSGSPNQSKGLGASCKWRWLGLAQTARNADRTLILKWIIMCWHDAACSGYQSLVSLYSFSLLSVCCRCADQNHHFEAGKLLWCNAGSTGDCQGQGHGGKFDTRKKPKIET